MTPARQTGGRSLPKRLRIVGISEMLVSDSPDETIITYSLSSCIGLTLYDPVLRTGGMIHCMLPMSKVDPEKAETEPCMFVDSGVVALLEELCGRGARRCRLIAKVAGCSSLLDDKTLFRIGQRNYAIMSNILSKNDILIAGEDVGGTSARSMFLYMDTGLTTIKKDDAEISL